MRTVNSIHISAPPDAVFRTASDVMNWATILPHYRWVRSGKTTDGVETVKMAAWRSFIPVNWESILSADADTRRIFFEHVGGLTTGMKVVWSIDPQDEGARVVITHELDKLRIPIVRSVPGKFITGRFFVEHVADRTLRAMKQWIEQKYAERS
jgi:hypothetical protein